MSRSPIRTGLILAALPAIACAAATGADRPDERLLATRFSLVF